MRPRGVRTHVRACGNDEQFLAYRSPGVWRSACGLRCRSGWVILSVRCPAIVLRITYYADDSALPPRLIRRGEC